MDDSAAPDRVDLEACSREPLHVPGAIQPHGLLLALDRRHRVAQVSANAHALLGGEPGQLLDRSAPDLLPPDLAERACGLTGGRPGSSAELVGVDVAGQRTDAFMHVNPQGVVVVELEPSARTSDGAAAERSLARLSIELGQLSLGDGLLERAAALVAELTAFDRVMVYRFDADFHGDVIAEHRARPDLGSLLHQRFPASDIPAQARALYVENPYRSIADVGYEPVPIAPVAHPDLAGPLDLTNALLRSVSPIHLEYLRNMGVSASMSLSLLDDRRLWGLIACHHHSGPLRVSPDARIGCRLLADVLSRKLVLEERAAERDRLARSHHAIATVLDRTLADESMSEALCSGGPELSEIVAASGAVVRVDGALSTQGEVPDRAAITELLDWFAGRDADDVLCTDHLSSIYPGGAAIADRASGVLAIALSREDAVLWFRPEQVRTDIWAGDPNKPVEISSDGRARLSPRKSFASWEEIVRGQSTPWESAHIDAARHLRWSLRKLAHASRDLTSNRRYLQQYALELESAVTDLSRANQALTQSNSDLEQFAYIASHDLQAPLRGVEGLGQLLRKRYAGRLDAAADECLESIIAGIGRMQRLIRDLLDYARADAKAQPFAAVDLQEVFAEATAVLAGSIEDAGGEVTRGELPTVVGDRGQLTRLLVNLIGNGLKYHGDRSPRVHVSSERVASRWRIRVADNGIGVAPADQDRIFEAFRRLHTEQDYPGTGLGLAICKRIADLHRGEIDVTSTPGQGTTFSVVLPADWSTEAGRSGAPAT